VLCQHYGVRIAGVIINKVIPEKYEQTKHYISKAMMQTWGIPLLGCIPGMKEEDLITVFERQLCSFSPDVSSFRTQIGRFWDVQH
jgi:cobyrinic acid a,c-diamide synthase